MLKEFVLLAAWAGLALSTPQALGAPKKKLAAKKSARASAVKNTPPTTSAPAAATSASAPAAASSANTPAAAAGPSAPAATIGTSAPPAQGSSTVTPAPATSQAAQKSSAAPNPAAFPSSVVTAKAKPTAASTAKPAAASGTKPTPDSTADDDDSNGELQPAAKPAKPAKPAKKKLTEDVVIQPEVIYRTAGLTLRRDSVYYKKSESDNFADQLYVVLNFSKTYDYRDQVVIVPGVRTKVKSNETEAFIEQGYIRSELTNTLELTAGKKNEVSGSGFLVNPSDLLNEGRDVFDPLLQREGQVFVRLAFRVPSFSLGLGFIPKAHNSVEKGRPWLVMQTDALDFDVKVQMTGSEHDKFTLGLTVARFFGEHVEFHVDGRYQSRQRSEVEYPERDFSSYGYKDPSTFYAVGSRIVITGKRSIVGEYISQQSGLLPVEMQSLFDAEAEKEPENRKQIQHLIGRKFAFLAYIDEDTFKSTSMSLTGTMNNSDGSAFGSLLVKYKLSPLSSVEVQPTFFSGKLWTEFGESPYKYIYYGTFRGKF